MKGLQILFHSEEKHAENPLQRLQDITGIVYPEKFSGILGLLVFNNVKKEEGFQKNGYC